MADIPLDSANQLLNAFIHRKKTRDNSVALYAQRLVNLFRQLSVFKPEFVAEYNKMLLNSSDEVRMMMKDIVGGPTVRQYLEYLQAKSEQITDEDEKENAEKISAINSNTGYLPHPDEDRPFVFGREQTGDEIIADLPQSDMLAQILGVFQENNRKQIEVLTDALKELKNQFKTAGADVIQNQSGKAELTAQDLVQFQQAQQAAFEQLIRMQNESLSELAAQFAQSLAAREQIVSPQVSAVTSVMVKQENFEDKTENKNTLVQPDEIIDSSDDKTTELKNTETESVEQEVETQTEEIESPIVSEMTARESETGYPLENELVSVSSETDISEETEDEDSINAETDIPEKTEDEDSINAETEIFEETEDEDDINAETDIPEEIEDEDGINAETDIFEETEDEDSINAETDIPEETEDEDSINAETEMKSDIVSESHEPFEVVSEKEKDNIFEYEESADKIETVSIEDERRSETEMIFERKEEQTSAQTMSLPPIPTIPLSIYPVIEETPIQSEGKQSEIYMNNEQKQENAVIRQDDVQLIAESSAETAAPYSMPSIPPIPQIGMSLKQRSQFGSEHTGSQMLNMARVPQAPMFHRKAPAGGAKFSKLTPQNKLSVTPSSTSVVSSQTSEEEHIEILNDIEL